MMNRLGVSRFLTGVCLVVGCAGLFDDTGDVQTWALAASPSNMYARALGPISIARGWTTLADPSCPTTFWDGQYSYRLNIVGGCSESGGRQWVGSVSVSADYLGANVTFDSFGNFAGTEPRALLSGKIALLYTRRDPHVFKAHFVELGDTAATFHFEGEVEASFDGPSLWNGTGRVERDGPVDPSGQIIIQTIDELIDDSVCPGQPLSGQQKLESEGQVAIIDYDGATDCDAAQTAQLAVDGEARGAIALPRSAQRPVLTQ